MNILSESFYARDTLDVARDLLGKTLIVSEGSLSIGGMIVETEAYFADDPASHCARGLTPRCAPMFEDPGRAYVYFIYGMYEMLNFVTELVGRPGAVLIRAIEPTVGIDVILERRKGIPRKNWSNGPGRLTRALGITLSDNRVSLQGPRLRVLDSVDPSFQIMESPRVGISQATDKYWRFFIAGHPDVSRTRENQLARAVS